MPETLGAGRMSEAAVPKVELHCHLDGIVDPAMLRELARQGHELPVELETVEAAYPVQGMAEFFRWFKTTVNLTGDFDRNRLIMGLHIERLKSQGVVYAEIMMSSGDVSYDRSQAIEEVTDFREWLNEQEAGEIQVELLVHFLRNFPLERIPAIVDKLIPL